MSRMPSLRAAAYERSCAGPRIGFSDREGLDRAASN